MYDYFLPQALRNAIDSIFSPPLTFIQLARSYLNHASLVAGHGININNYLGLFNYLPGPMRSVLDSLFASIVVLSILLLVKVIMRMYYAFKDGAKWW
ncbi:hypothetical protein KIH86_25345 [Paenibacillus sp. HN-1]|uniref:hypothetical protein n=1 Tax=Paenibacillus TaxID=44249 RepID=UPI001CA8EAAB|nr:MULTISPECIES: hypothetical protein [Paenibacillus]MBY9082622.1 hypothetical protein [Paenibacillus sp. CGMCC 1.18879]MBY9087517.1 hypothetical protein [Paenibacillus sinensis]